MDETPLTFDMPPNRMINNTGEKTIKIHTMGNKKNRVTVVLVCCGDGSKLKPMVICDLSRENVNKTGSRLKRNSVHKPFVSRSNGYGHPFGQLWYPFRKSLHPFERLGYPFKKNLHSFERLRPAVRKKSPPVRVLGSAVQKKLPSVRTAWVSRSEKVSTRSSAWLSRSEKITIRSNGLA